MSFVANSTFFRFFTPEHLRCTVFVRTFVHEHSCGMLKSNKYKPLKKQKLMEKGKRRSEGLATMAGFLMVLAAMLLTACDGLLPKGGGSQGWETEDTEEPSEEKAC